MNEQNVVVECECAEFGKSFLDAAECAFDRAHRDGIDLLEKRCPALAVGHVEYDAVSAFSRDDEVTLCIPDAPSRVDILGSFGDHPSAVDGDFFLAVMPVFPEYLRTMRFDPPAVDRCDVATDRTAGDPVHVLVVLLDAT